MIAKIKAKRSLWQKISWRQIRAALADIYNCKSYYLGGTLCIDFEGYAVALNRNGRGFAVHSAKSDEYPVELTFIMTREDQKKVNQLYKEIKQKCA